MKASGGQIAVDVLFVAEVNTVAVFVDVIKAYDTTCKCGTMSDLQRAGLRGRFGEGFFKNRQFQVSRD